MHFFLWRLVNTLFNAVNTHVIFLNNFFIQAISFVQKHHITFALSSAIWRFILHLHIENKKKIRLFSREFQNVKFLVPPQNLARFVFLQTIGLLNTYCAIFCAFGVNSQNTKDILEVCVTWMRYMKVNLPFGFGSFDFCRRRREEKWVCHQGSLWAPWSCNRAPRACCKGM